MFVCGRFWMSHLLDVFYLFVFCSFNCVCLCSFSELFVNRLTGTLFVELKVCVRLIKLRNTNNTCFIYVHFWMNHLLNVLYMFVFVHLIVFIDVCLCSFVFLHLLSLSLFTYAKLCSWTVCLDFKWTNMNMLIF